MSSVRKDTQASERLLTENISDVSIEHIHRYAFVVELLKGKIVLDIASGEGYGSNLISYYAEKVYGVDISESAIENAKLKYTRSNIEFLKGSTSNIPMPNNSVDVILSFETIEHHDEHHQMMQEFKRVLKTDGVLILSSPDKLNYSDKTGHNNPYHIKELYKDELIELVNTYFNNHILYYQKYLSNSIIFNKAINGYKMLEGDFNTLHQYNIEDNSMYFVCLASDSELIPLSNSLYNSNIDYELRLKNAIKNVQNSWSFKIGNLILFPFILLKRYFARK